MQQNIIDYFEFSLMPKFFTFEHTDLFISTIFASVFLFIGISSLKINSTIFYKVFKPDILLYLYLLQALINDLFLNIKFLQPLTELPCYFIILFISLYIIAYCLCCIIEFTQRKKR